MADLSTTYAGIELKNPIIIGASNLVTNVDNLVKLERAGAAAIVYKSLFEEQIQLGNHQQETTQGGVAEYIDQLREARQALLIPLIGSLNCTSKELWVEYAKKMEGTGIDALELNFYASELKPEIESHIIEENQIETFSAVKRAVKIPVIVKLSPFYTNVLRHIMELDRAGAKAFVLFNRLFQPDIDIDNEEHHFPYNLSSENDNRLSLRYAGMLSRRTKGSVCCNTGILTGADVIKMLLAGADTVQVVSAVYKKGINYISQMLEDVNSWMETKGYRNVNQFIGKLSRDMLSDPFAYRRAQYVDILMKSDSFMVHRPGKGEKEEGDVSTT